MEKKDKRAAYALTVLSEEKLALSENSKKAHVPVLLW
jgi:hypothetical protein